MKYFFPTLSFEELEDEPTYNPKWFYVRDGTTLYHGVVEGFADENTLQLGVVRVAKFNQPFPSYDDTKYFFLKRDDIGKTVYVYRPPDRNDETLRLIVDHPSETNATFFIKGKRVPGRYQLGRSQIYLLNDKRQACITMSLQHNTLFLENYYYETPLSACDALSHKTFFNLANCIAGALHYDIALRDESFKPTGPCKIPRDVMALAKGRTFYQTHGFVNKEYDADIRRVQGYHAALSLAIQPSTWSQFVETHALDPAISLKQLAVKLIDMCKASDVDENVHVLMQAFKHLVELKRHSLFTKTVPREECRIKYLDDAVHIYFQEPKRKTSTLKLYGKRTRKT